jgi:hypothetical protein
LAQFAIVLRDSLSMSNCDQMNATNFWEPEAFSHFWGVRLMIPFHWSEFWIFIYVNGINQKIKCLRCGKILLIFNRISPGSISIRINLNFRSRSFAWFGSISRPSFVRSLARSLAFGRFVVMQFGFGNDFAHPQDAFDWMFVVQKCESFLVLFPDSGS